MERPRLPLSRCRIAAMAALLAAPFACGGGGSSGGSGGASMTGTGGVPLGSGGTTGTGGQPATSTGGAPVTGRRRHGRERQRRTGRGHRVGHGGDGGTGQTGGSGGGRATGGAAGGGTGGVPATVGALSPTPAGARLVITGVRGVTTSAATLGIDYLNGAATATSITGAAFGAVDQVSTTFTPSTQDAHTTAADPQRAAVPGDQPQDLPRQRRGRRRHSPSPPSCIPAAPAFLRRPLRTAAPRCCRPS